jgi:hypothetical protein
MLRASKPNDEFLPISPTNSATASTDHSLIWRMRPIVASRRVHAAEDRNGSFFPVGALSAIGMLLPWRQVSKGKSAETDIPALCDLRL